MMASLMALRPRWHPQPREGDCKRSTSSRDTPDDRDGRWPSLSRCIQKACGPRSGAAGFRHDIRRPQMTRTTPRLMLIAMLSAGICCGDVVAQCPDDWLLDDVQGFPGLSGEVHAATMWD